MRKFLALILTVLILVPAFTAWAEEDGQNPVMNLIGPYMDRVGQRAVMDIRCSGKTDAQVEIRWGSGASETTVWSFCGPYDPEEGIIAYECCVKTNLVYDENGNEQAEVVYEDGTGRLIIAEEGIILWQDDMEDAGKDCAFEFAPSQTEELSAAEKLAGNYAATGERKANLFLSCDGKSLVNAEIVADDGQGGIVSWRFYGIYDEKDGTIPYEGGVKSVMKKNEQGALSEEVLEYEDGTGSLLVLEDGTVSWTDDLENAGEGLVFERLVESGDSEDGQNPVMNLIGSYMDEVSQRASMTIRCAGQQDGEVEIFWSTSAFETTVWTFTGTYRFAGEGEMDEVVYENCVKTNLTYDEDGKENAEVVYEGGTGKLLIDDDWKIRWEDDMEDAGKDCVFVYSGI